jgi:phosphinothricin acetyltransferase
MVRQANKKDCDKIVEIYNQHILKGSSSMDTIKSNEDILKWINNYTDREGIFVFEESNQIKGWGVIKKYSDRFGYRFAGEISIYIDNSYLKHGIGNIIHHFLINKAKSLKYEHLTAKIFANNTTSINFFKKHGYSIVGKQHKIGYVNDKWIDVVIMEKLLD